MPMIVCSLSFSPFGWHLVLLVLGFCRTDPAASVPGPVCRGISDAPLRFLWERRLIFFFSIEICGILWYLGFTTLQQEFCPFSLCPNEQMCKCWIQGKSPFDFGSMPDVAWQQLYSSFALAPKAGQCKKWEDWLLPTTFWQDALKIWL